MWYICTIISLVLNTNIATSEHWRRFSTDLISSYKFILLYKIVKW